MSDITSYGSGDNQTPTMPTTPTEKGSLIPCSSSQKPCKTRRSLELFGLGKGITKEDATITGSRLPTSSQVLRCMMYHINEGLSVDRTKWEAAKHVLKKVKIFYEKAGIPIICDRKACEKIIKVLDNNAKNIGIPSKRRNNPTSLKKVKEMEEQLAKTFPLWPGNAESLIKNTEDLCFLQSMKEDRLATFGSRDKVLENKLKRKQERRQSETVRRKNAK